MPRQSRKRARPSRRGSDNAAKLIAAGVAFAVLPLFLSKSPFGRAFTALIPLGLLLIVAGALLLWYERRQRSPPARLDEVSIATPATQTIRRAVPPPPPPVDRTVAELERSARETNAPGRTTPKRPQVWSTEVFDAIEWRRFEAVVETLFGQAGFETKAQSHGADGGVDVWLYARGRPDQPVSLVQCKHWQGKKVGVDKIRELRGVMAAHGVNRGQFATTSTFTPDAISFASANGINLLDTNALLALIDRTSPDQRESLLKVALEGEYWKPTCVNCGIKMVERTPRSGGAAFWGCTNYPKCKTTMPMRLP